MKTLTPLKKVTGRTVKASTTSKAGKQIGDRPVAGFEHLLGGAENLPDDLAANHDYYLHGLPKQRPRRHRWIPASTDARGMTRQEASRFTDHLLSFASEICGLPADLAAHHDHYLHGLPKSERCFRRCL